MLLSCTSYPPTEVRWNVKLFPCCLYTPRFPRKFRSRVSNPQKNDSWQSLDTHNGEEGNLDTYSGSKKENGETDGGAQALLKHQARRYNDLRTAYESLWRRLECRDETRRPGSGGNNWRLKHTKSDLLRRGIVAPDSVRARGAPESDVGKRPCCGDGLLSRSIGIQ